MHAQPGPPRFGKVYLKLLASSTITYFFTKSIQHPDSHYQWVSLVLSFTLCSLATVIPLRWNTLLVSTNNVNQLRCDTLLVSTNNVNQLRCNTLLVSTNNVNQLRCNTQPPAWTELGECCTVTAEDVAHVPWHSSQSKWWCWFVDDYLPCCTQHPPCTRKLIGHTKSSASVFKIK